MPDYFHQAFPGVEHIRKQWDQGGEFSYRFQLRPERNGNGERTYLAGPGRRAWAWMTLPGLRLKSLDIQISSGLLADIRTNTRPIPSPGAQHQKKRRVRPVPTPRISVDKLVIRENTRSWLMLHRTAMQLVLTNYQHVQELALDFRLPPHVRDLRSHDELFSHIAPPMLPDCTKLTFRFMPSPMESYTIRDFREMLLRSEWERRHIAGPLLHEVLNSSDETTRPLGGDYLVRHRCIGMNQC